MNIVSTQYTLKTKSLELYLAGCSGQPKCKNCHNPVLWDFNIGEKFDNIYFNKEILNKYKEFKPLIKNVMIFGGEPLDQNFMELELLLIKLTELSIPIWLFTRYSIDEVPLFVKQYCEYIKCGRYIPELKGEFEYYGIILSTSNQKIYKKGIDY